MSKFPAPVVVPLKWADYGEFLSVAVSARSGCKYVIHRVPGGPEGVIWERFRPNQSVLSPYFTVVGNIRSTASEAKEACAISDAYEAEHPCSTEQKASEVPNGNG